VATILILRMLARRWRRSDTEQAAVPYGPELDPPERAKDKVLS
jgi:hypothetical protein